MNLFKLNVSIKFFLKFIFGIFSIFHFSGDFCVRGEMSNVKT
jgi:hypothetical protein